MLNTTNIQDIRI